jgi:hypothetical protein
VLEITNLLSEREADEREYRQACDKGRDRLIEQGGRQLHGIVGLWSG